MAANKKAEPAKQPEADVKEFTVSPTGEAIPAEPVVQQSITVPAPQDQEVMSPEFSLALAQRRVNQFKGIVKLIAANTNPADLYVFCSTSVQTVDDLMKFKAYLPLHACQNILAWVGALWLPEREVVERRDSDELGQFIEYDMWAEVETSDGREVRVMGSCSTRHPFHGVAYTFYGCPICRDEIGYGKKCPKHLGGRPRKLNQYRPLSDVNRGNVRKHAITNTFNKAVDALGLTPTLRDLKEAGMDITRIPRANFGRDTGDGEGAPSTQGGAAPSQATKPATAQKQTATQAPGPTGAPATTAKEPSNAPAGAAPKSSQAPPDVIVKGKLEKVARGVTKPKDKKTGKPRTDEHGNVVEGTPFLTMMVSGEKINTFDNKELALDTRGHTMAVFDLLTDPFYVGVPVEFICKQAGQWKNVSRYVRIGSYEWDEQGVPVLRRDAPQPAQQPAQQTQSPLPRANVPPFQPGDSYEATDDDLGPGFFPE